MKHSADSRGLVEFNVVTDVAANLEPICKIALTWNTGISHYRVVPYDDGSVALYLFWHDCKGRNTPLPFELKEPKVMADFILNWLKQNDKYPNDYYGGDGHLEKGIRITSECNHNDVREDSFYMVAAVEPEWVYYSK